MALSLSALALSTSSSNFWLLHLPSLDGGVGVVERLEEVLDQRVVHLPARAPGSGHLLRGDLVAEVGEGADGPADARLVVAHDVVDAVADRVDPLLVGAGVGVVRDLELAAGDAAALLDQLLGLAPCRTRRRSRRGPSLKPPSSPRTGEVQSEAGVRVFWKIWSVICVAVDRHRQALADLARVRGVPGLVVEREGEGLDDAGGCVDVAVAQVRLDVLELRGGHVVDQVEVARRSGRCRRCCCRCRP